MMSLNIALIQSTATEDIEKNLHFMKSQLYAAKELDAKVAVFGEMAYLLAPLKSWVASLDRYLSLKELFAGWAKELEIDLIPGTLREPVSGTQFYNTLLYFDSRGSLISEYRKLFLFRADLEDRSYDETKHCVPGTKVVVADTKHAKAGFGVCYDLRFPELFRSMGKQGAQIIYLPSAFTIPTGMAHWECLIKARAIENQCFIVAPNLVGNCGDGRQSYGHSLIVSPWGEIMTQLGDREDMQVTELLFDEIQQAKKRINVWASTREKILPI